MDATYVSPTGPRCGAVTAAYARFCGRRTGRWRVVVLALALAGCGFDVQGDQPMAAPDVYRTWWAKTEACSGLTGDFDRVQWEVVPGASFTCSSGQCAGHWQSDHRIWSGNTD